MKDKLFQRPYGERVRVRKQFHFPSLAQQSFRDECDINRIMAKYLKTGVMPEGTRPPRFEDCTGATDYHTAHNLMLQAHEMFYGLPAAVRREFDNDPGLFLQKYEEAQQGASPELTEHFVTMGLMSTPKATEDLKKPNPPPPAAETTNVNDESSKEGGTAT